MYISAFVLEMSWCIMVQKLSYHYAPQQNINLTAALSFSSRTHAAAEPDYRSLRQCAALYPWWVREFGVTLN
jgi:hypothetical protein